MLPDTTGVENEQRDPVNAVAKPGAGTKSGAPVDCCEPDVPVVLGYAVPAEYVSLFTVRARPASTPKVKALSTDTPPPPGAITSDDA
jgi:hypothetical protein